jgi:hypothetical protein
MPNDGFLVSPLHSKALSYLDIMSDDVDGHGMGGVCLKLRG